MNYKVNKVLGAIVCTAFIYILLFASIQMNAFSRGFYASENSKLDIAETMNISNKDYNKGMDSLLSYIEGSKEDIHIDVKIRDVKKALFNEKEDSHMVDVKNLYQNARLVCFIALGVGIPLLVFLIYKNKKAVLDVLSESFTKVSIAFLMLFSFLVLYAVVDFYSFWNAFHGVFFSNDLWLLDPSVDNMIRMLPQDVFFSLVFRIIGMFVVTYVITLTLSIWYRKKLVKGK